MRTRRIRAAGRRRSIAQFVAAAVRAGVVTVSPDVWAAIVGTSQPAGVVRLGDIEFRVSPYMPPNTMLAIQPMKPGFDWPARAFLERAEDFPAPRAPHRSTSLSWSKTAHGQQAS